MADPGSLTGLGTVLSAEVPDGDGTIQVAYMANPTPVAFAATRWHDLVDLADFQSLATGLLVDRDGVRLTFAGLADHWHIYAFESHWIACSLTADIVIDDPVTGVPRTERQSIGVGLVKFRYPSFSLAPVIDFVALVYLPTSASDYGAGGRPVLATNDLHICEDSSVDGNNVVEDRIAVVVSHPITTGRIPDKGSVVIRVDAASGLPEAPINLYGTALSGASLEHSAGASSRPDRFSYGGARTEPGFEMLAPTTLNPNEESAVHRFSLAEEWLGVDVEPVSGLDTPGEHHSMAMQAEIPGSTPAVFTLIYKQFTAGASPYADFGTIILELRFAGLARALESHTLSSVGNRPHVLVVGTTVIATWDELLSTTSGATQVMMQVFTAA